MLTTTFRRAREAGACIKSYRKFAKYKGGVSKWGKDKPFPLTEVLEVCGFDDTLWALRIVIEPADKAIRLFACDCAERTLPAFERKYLDDKGPRIAIETSRKFAEGQATKEELAAARDAAGDAAWAAGATARAAAWAAAGAAWAAAGDAARTAAWAAEREWQKQHLIQMLLIAAT